MVFGHRNCQTNEVKSLCLNNIYQKFHRSNIYDIGGTYIKDVPDYWFTYRTEQVGDIFLLHIFAGNNIEGNYTIGLSSGNELQLNKRSNIAYLSETIKYTSYKIKDKKCHVYITTYSFTDLDVEFLKDRKLYISVQIDAHAPSLSADVVDNIKAQHDCRALLMDPVGADFIIESEEGVQFKVHKIIMMSHSDVFKAMLKDDTAESQNSFVRLVDVATDDVRAMLEYIYTGTIIDIENVNFTNILMLADRYDLKGMRELCNHALAQQLIPDNALDILLLADMYDSHSLKLTALKFIKRNREALNSGTFNEINNMALVRELCTYLAS